MDMGKLLGHVFAADSIMLLLIVYCAKSNLCIPGYGKWWSLLLLVILTLLLARLCIVGSERLSMDSIIEGITEIEPVNETYLPVYLSFFFVALSIPDHDYFTLGIIILIIMIFLERSQTMFYNPVFLIFKYQFYHVRSNGVRILIITKRNIRTMKGLSFPNLRRINDYTYIDMEKKK